MNRLFRYIFLGLSSLCLAACSGTIDDPNNVPEGTLRIFADKTEISADGSDEVTFTVMFGSQDVSTEKTLQLVRIFDGKEKYMPYGSNKFSTVTAGTYTFTAKYYYAGNHVTDNEIEIVAKPFFSGEEKNYKARYFGTLFTSTGCAACPESAKGLKEVMDMYPGEISAAAFHAHYSSSILDPMTIPETSDFAAACGGFTGLPAFFWNMSRDTYFGGSFTGTMFAEKLEEFREDHKVYSGVAVTTSYDEASRKLDIEVGITSNNPSSARYLVILVEDDIPAVGDHEQQSNVNLGDYSHNNVVRDVLTGAKGDKFPGLDRFTVGVEAKASKSVTLDSGWNAENMRVIVVSMVSEDGDNNWSANNVNECKVGGSAPYLYEEE